MKKTQSTIFWMLAFGGLCFAYCLTELLLRENLPRFAGLNYWHQFTGVGKLSLICLGITILLLVSTPFIKDKGAK